MIRITTLLQKLQDLATSQHQKTAIDADLMLDYTRVIYADLLELRRLLPVAAPVGPASLKEPTLAELSEQLAQEQEPELRIATAAPVLTQSPAAPSQRPSPPAQNPVTPPPAQAMPAPATKETPVQQRPEHIAVPPSPSDLRRHIGINDKYRFISELFGNDVQAYERAIDTLNKMHSAAEAGSWVRENLWIREDADAEEVLEAFRIAVSAHFTTK